MSKGNNKAAQVAHEIVAEAVSLQQRLQQLATQLGVPVERVQSMQRQIEYRRLYNRRPEVQQKRKQYNQKRALMMKQVREVLSAK